MVDSGADVGRGAGRPSIDPRRKALFTAILLGLACAAILAGWEVVERVSHARWRAQYDNFGWLGMITVPSDDPVLKWEYKPYARARSGRPPWVMHTNRWGFRDRDHAVRSKPPGNARAAFVGDSVTLGMLVPERDTFVRQIERRAASTATLETLNFGVDGYDVRQIRRLLQTRVLGFEPDVVVYAVSLNDFDFWESSGEKALYFDPPTSFVARKAERAWQRLTRTDFHRYYYRRNRDVALDEITAMAGMLRDEGIGFVVALLPIFALQGTRGEDAVRLEFIPHEHLGSFAAYPFEDLHRDLAAALRDRGIEPVDLYPVFVADGRRPDDLALDVWHPNGEGHGVIAAALLGPVLDALPSAPSEQRVDQRSGPGGAEDDQ